ncbi:response regulator [Catenovulum adriaticum]|uniref:histidine kinase n=1 Tax=Catenovulum adriaticum TaxID=2984846 RepID=A0ABY7ALF2_9ALTE|nr:response regulator [Catenovulum sp. TS8]WAJ70082.1 ATP-binding protein [Catenovulum sp. TS8]
MAHSIALKVLSVLSLFIVALLVVYSILNYRINEIDNSVHNILNISSSSVSILEINKDIVELQRDISVYGQSGNSNIFSKIENNYQSIKQRLVQVKQQTKHSELLRLINSMQILVARYGENLQVLTQRYEIKTTLIDIDLPKLFESAEALIQTLYTQTDSNDTKLVLSNLMTNWYQMNRSARLFLTKKEYAQRRKVAETHAKIKAQINTIPLSFTQKHQISLEQLVNLTSEHNSTFSKSVQANRNYLTLVNVVMAGDAVEFTTLANQLRQASLDLLQQIKVQGSSNVESAKQIIKISIVIALVLFIIFAMFFHMHIIQAIKRLTNSFEAFLRGDLSAKISDIHRSDEIGILAGAANQFRTLSENLLEAKKEAEQTTKIKSDFLANMSHEIRTPMNGILGMVRLLSATELNTKQKKMLEVVNSSGKSLLVILNDILDLSKIESGKIELESIEFNLEQLCFELEQMFITQAHSANIQLIIPDKLPSPLTQIEGDETRLKQVLLNLLSNAVKFTIEGYVELNIKIVENYDNAVKIEFSVIDTGMGIAPENITSLFEAFSQADSSITRRFGGTGLGLTISSRLLDAMGSSLKVKSEVNKGTCFYFSLVLPTSNTPTKVATNLNKPTKLSFNPTLKVIIIEDNEINQTILAALLNEMNIVDIDLALNGKVGVEKCRENQYDLIFMDMQMPVMGGIEATTQIKRLDNYTNTPIIALTANVMENDKKACFDAGMNAFLTKPIEFKALAETMAQFVNVSHPLPLETS